VKVDSHCTFFTTHWPAHPTKSWHGKKRRRGKKWEAKREAVKRKGERTEFIRSSTVFKTGAHAFLLSVAYKSANSIGTLYGLPNSTRALPLKR
jgi:hypothetical protein